MPVKSVTTGKILLTLWAFVLPFPEVNAVDVPGKIVLPRKGLGAVVALELFIVVREVGLLVRAEVEPSRERTAAAGVVADVFAVGSAAGAVGGSLGERLRLSGRCGRRRH